jgi:hypothetical protein
MRKGIPPLPGKQRVRFTLRSAYFFLRGGDVTATIEGSGTYSRIGTSAKHRPPLQGFLHARGAHTLYISLFFSSARISLRIDGICL